MIVDSSKDKLLLRTLQGNGGERIPFWFMRQAGRYLPEYRETRKRAGSFLHLCFNPELATEVTLQPIRRFGMDGAILFSDILVIPHALGVSVTFAEGEGPLVEQTTSSARIAQLRVNDIPEKLAPVFEAIRLIRRALPAHTTLLGFAGAPWTVACYMLQGRGGKEFQAARLFAYAQPQAMQQLIDILTEATIDYLRRQLDAGVDAVQLFDSWAGLLTPRACKQWVFAPAKKIAAALNASHPQAPLIGFPKGGGAWLASYSEATNIRCLGVDQHSVIHTIQEQLPQAILQGNLDPLLVAADKEGAVKQTEFILESMGKKPFVFNLGHGFIPETPIAHVEAICEKVKEHKI